ncbi:hypothetical protein RGQ15_10360 [Paracoccus sp. MBLB3053]|uniref:Uncharacterized protein n=1 Tax=Paracoccus aurantius TaxID=3073814 RepID=A0ABU2HSF0_9RHOB|nr:hypothetical protein [Paracoccus sp. MBLB3053]MDS9467967.1 hypothetical protein [Paracoccus sp. MBLB3053]
MPPSDEPSNITNIAAERFKRAEQQGNHPTDFRASSEMGISIHPVICSLFDLANTHLACEQICRTTFIDATASKVGLTLHKFVDEYATEAFFCRVQGLALQRLFGTKNALRHAIEDSNLVWSEGIGPELPRSELSRLTIIDGIIFAELIGTRALPYVQDMIAGATKDNPVVLSSDFLLNHLMTPYPLSSMRETLHELALDDDIAQERRSLVLSKCLRVLQHASNVPIDTSQAG